jgi:hypothetical protein
LGAASRTSAARNGTRDGSGRLRSCARLSVVAEQTHPQCFRCWRQAAAPVLRTPADQFFPLWGAYHCEDSRGVWVGYSLPRRKGKPAVPAKNSRGNATLVMLSRPGIQERVRPITPFCCCGRCPVPRASSSLDRSIDPVPPDFLPLCRRISANPGVARTQPVEGACLDAAKSLERRREVQQSTARRPYYVNRHQRTHFT